MSDTGGRPPRLLVSVRDAEEALAAIAGGADVIDVKNPSAGPLGAAAIDAVLGVAAAVASAARPGIPWTIACGELVEEGIDGVARRVREICSGIEHGLPRPWLVKVGLSSVAGRAWRDDLAEIAARLPPGVVQAVVAYADWRACGAPDPEAVCLAARGLGGVVLLDTFDKASGGVFTISGVSAVAGLADLAAREGVTFALAGRLGREDAGRVAAVRPDIVAVRTAVCRGGRMGRVEPGLTALVRRELCRPSHAGMLSPGASAGPVDRAK